MKKISFSKEETIITLDKVNIKIKRDYNLASELYSTIFDKNVVKLKIDK